MDKKKRILVLLSVTVCVAAVLFFVVIKKDQNGAQPGENKLVGLPIENLGQTKNDPDLFEKEILGKIKTIEENNLVVVDDASPLKGMTKDGVSPEVSLKTTNTTLVFFIKKGNAKEVKSLADLRIGDLVRVGYSNLTKEAGMINVSIGGADLNNLSN